jgi:hypothetical protein
MTKKLISCGHGGLDLEGVIDGSNVLVQNKDSQEFVSLPRYLCAKDSSGFYLGRIDSASGNGQVSVPLNGGKNDFESTSFFQNEHELNRHLTTNQIDNGHVFFFNANVALGQGALNSIYGASVFANDAFRDIVPYFLLYPENEVIMGMLPKKLQNGRCIGVADGDPLTNMCLKGLSEKLTFRTNLNPECRLKTKVLDKFFEGVNEDDAVYLNSVKSVEFAEYLFDKIKEKETDAYLFLTDSMVDKLSKERIRDNLKLFRVYCSKVDELAYFLDGGKNGDRQHFINYLRGLPEEDFRGGLRNMMLELRSRMKKIGKRELGRVYLTDDSRGSYALAEDGTLYYHPVGKNLPVKNQSGCGDAFAGVLSYKELDGASAHENLAYASIAGQIKAGLSSPCSEDMATPRRINEFLMTHNELRHATEYKFSMEPVQVDLIPDYNNLLLGIPSVRV